MSLKVKKITAQLNTYADRNNDRSGGLAVNKLASWFPPAPFYPVNHSAPKPEDRMERYRRQRDEAETLVESMKSKLTKLEPELSAQQEANKDAQRRFRALEDKKEHPVPKAASATTPRLSVLYKS
ncbi:hypothetical protein HYALB_00000337 [Hymenoscyphus albidus]|uniref:Uncharacterized protein n=1 Tax=Hymenoscyphus albidus TaxID=595503 RepID=A0A9N9LKR7_9HELO|nr:hypothetical protein HYALB_00000337 [Hymenoscyphus albidus]